MWRKVKDVMTVDVATASEGTSYKELVRLLGERHITALPVVDADQRVLGIVSEADLLDKQDHPVGALQRPWARAGAAWRGRGHRPAPLGS